MPKFTAALRTITGKIIAARNSRGGTGFTPAELVAAEQHAANHGGKILHPIPVGPHSSSTPTPSKAEKAIAWMRQHIGQHETPPGSNRGLLPDAVLTAAHCPLGNPWCCAMACAAWTAAGITVPGGSTAGCAILREAAEHAGRWSTRLVVGGIAIVKPDEHAGIVTAILPGGMIRLIAGNTSQTDGRNPNGGCVAEHTLPASIFMGCVTP